MPQASVFESLNQTVQAQLRGDPTLGLPVVALRKAPIRFTADSQPGIYVAPRDEQPVGYAFGGVVIIEYSLDVVIVAPGDQKLDAQSADGLAQMSLQPQRVESVRLLLDVGSFPEGLPSVKESRWESGPLYDRAALNKNYDVTALRFYYKSDEVRIQRSIVSNLVRPA